jgi:hypothetical protein
MFEDLQTTTIENANIAGSQVCLKHFLMTIHFLQCYPTEHEISAKFGIDEKTARKWIKFFVLRIHALKPQKVRCMHKYTLIHILLTIFLLTTLQIIWPRQWDNVYGASNFIISVDGTHCPIQEPQHDVLRINREYYSHKINRAALNYEVALSLFHDKIVWVSDPYPASTHDITVFRDNLIHLIPPNKKVIGDKGYNGLGEMNGRTNQGDNEVVRRFKRRARCRQETVNSRIKSFRCLQVPFHHQLGFHRDVFNAVCIVVQYQLDNGSGLLSV